MSSAAMPTSDPLFAVRYLDVLIILLAAPFVLLMGAPVLGFVAGGAAWIVGRLIGVWVERWARANKDPRAQVGIAFAVLMGRVWLVALTILLVGLEGERKDGLMAALLALVVFTVYFTTTLLLRPMERNAPPS
jgi:hypothetical protein